MTFNVVRKKLYATEGFPPNSRYDPDCDCVVTTPDGGTTWNNDDGSDPRKNPGYQLPPNTESDPQCASAAGMVQGLRNYVDGIVDASTVASIISAISGVALVFLPVGILFLLIAAIADAIFAIGTGAIALAFTEGVYEDLLCIFYCHLAEDGTLTEDDIDDIQADIATIIDNEIVEIVAGYWFGLMGAVGMNNTGAKLADGEADCSSCECEWEQCYDFGVDDGGYVTLDGTSAWGLWVSADGWQSQYTVGIGSQALAVHKVFDESGHVTFVSVTITLSGGYGHAFAPLVNVYDLTGGFRIIASSLINAGTDTYTFGIAEDLAEIGFNVNLGSPGEDAGLAVINSAILRGTGTQPTFGYDCP